MQAFHRGLNLSSPAVDLRGRRQRSLPGAPIACFPGRRAPRGFTLFELILTLFLLGLLASILWINLDATQHSEDLPESVRRMKSAIAMCRAEAMREGRRYRLRFHRDGSIDITRQLDPIAAPHLACRIASDWAQAPVLLGDVWIEAVQPMPDGPPPIGVEDDELQLTKFDIEAATPVAEMQQPFELWFEPDGTSTSARWILRHAYGTGVRMLLDGRVGRITTDDPPAMEDNTRPERPQAVPIEEKTNGVVEDAAAALAEYQRGDEI